MKKSILFFCVASLLGSFSIAAAAPFQNGSFESLGAGSGRSTYFFPLPPDVTFPITGWTLESGAVSYVGTFWQAAEGSSSVGLSYSTTPGSLSQTFDTVAGTMYDVIFAMAGNPGGGEPEKNLNVNIANFSGDFNFDTSNTSVTNMGWTDMLFTFSATGPLSTLTFMSLEDNTFGPAIDNVRVTVAGGGGTPVPEPATLMLLGAGLIGVGFFGRKKFVN